jgi:hypothetical protein
VIYYFLVSKFHEVITMQSIFKIIKGWLPIAIATAGVCGLAYLTTQQSLRMGANDPQIQMVEDAATSLNAGGSVDSIVPAAKVEIATSLAPFLMVFDDNGKVLASSATLHGAVPDYPMGVLDTTRLQSQDRVTWQPEPGVRMASVAMHYANGFVVAGRSLREVEKRADQAMQLSILAMLAIWGATLVVVILGELIGRKKSI